MIELLDRVYNCAHRGASGQAPENTLAALDLAVKLGADMAEIDVQPTADGQLVVFHDDTLERTSSGTGRLTARTLAELRTLDAGSWFSRHYAGQKIPTLAEIMEVARGRLDLNIELKVTGHPPGLLNSVRATVADQGFTHHCVVTSFDRGLIDELALIEPAFALGYIIGGDAVPPGVFGARIDLLSLEKSLVRTAELEFAAAAGQAVHAWTVNTTEEMGRLLELGVGGVITNYPDRFPTPGPASAG
jgi:glycerophosphoryl diester phosphodiesterase